MLITKTSKNTVRLGKYHEIVGILEKVAYEDNSCILKFSCWKEIELPSTVIPQKKLLSLVGHRVGIFNCDGRYTYRVITDNVTKKSTDKKPHIKNV